MHNIQIFKLTYRCLLIEDGDDEKPGSTFATPPPRAMSPTSHPLPSSSAAPHLLLQRLQELSPNRYIHSHMTYGSILNFWITSYNTVCACYKCVKTLSALTAHCTNVYLCSLGCEIVTLLDEYLHGNVCKDLENVKGGASGLQHFQCILSRACVSLHRCRFSNITSFHALLQLFEKHLNNDCYMSWQKVIPDLFITARLTRRCLVWRLWRKCLIILAAISPFPQCRYIPLWFYTNIRLISCFFQSILCL